MSRPSFEQINMAYAEMLAERSTCARQMSDGSRAAVGCVITSVDFRYVYGIGYNGGAAGLKNDCDRHGPEAVGNCGCVHSEANAAINCRAARDVSKIVFVTHLPCVNCCKFLINLGGVRKVFYRNDYRIKDSLWWFKQAGIQTGWLQKGFTEVQAISASMDALSLFVGLMKSVG